MAYLAVHRASRSCRESPTIDQRQSRIQLLSEIGSPAAIIGEGRNRRQNVLIPARPTEAGLHPPNGQQWPGWDAKPLLDGGEECGIRLLERTTASDDGRAAALGEKLIERQAEASLATISSNGCSRIGSR